MNTTSRPLGLRHVQVTDSFWHREMELVRREVIPYQWEALNDRVPDAEPSYCMHNFHAAARALSRRRAEGAAFRPKFTMNGFVQLPEEGKAPDAEHFYGFVFQDSDCYKWLEAVAYSLMTHPDPALEETADRAIDDVCAAQAEDGYLDTCFILGGMDKRFTNLKDLHEMYCLGHLVEAAVAYHQATGKDKLLQAACRFADCCAAHLGRGEGLEPGYPGHEIAEMALLRLYEETGEERYLHQACYLIDERGQAPHYFDTENQRRNPGVKPLTPSQLAYHQAHQPVRAQDEAVGHAVRAMYLYSGMADAARMTGDAALRESCERLWHSTVEEKLYITGGVGGTHVGEAFSYPYDLPNDTAYSETCAAIGLVFFARRMLQLHADSRYADVMEQALYNTVLSGMALDGRSFFYVNPLQSDPVALERDERVKHVNGVRQKWFGCACCPPNIARLVSSLGDYAYTADEGTLYTHLYISGTAEAVLNGQPVTLKVESSLPWQGRVTVTVSAAAPVHGVLAFRMPGWSDAPSIACEGRSFTVRDGYAYAEGDWQDGEVIVIELPMRVRMMRAHNRVREDAGQVAFVRGPITYCGEQADNGDQLQLLRIHPADVLRQGVQVTPDERFGHEVMMLEVPAVRLTEDSGALYAEWAPAAEEPAVLRLIPYYCWANRGLGEMRTWWHLA